LLFKKNLENVILINYDEPSKPDAITQCRFLNRAALKAEGDTNSDSSIAKPWRLCSVQQVEDLKSLMRIFPILSSGIFLSTPIGVLMSLTVLQALTMDRHLRPHFKIPAGTVIVFILTSTAISLTLIDRILYPIWQKLSHRSPMPLQRIALGHVFNALGMVVAALVESKRLKITQTHHLIDDSKSNIPMSVLWLVPQLAVVGIGEAFHYPGQVTLYYQEFPTSLRSTSTAMYSMIMGIAYYMSNAVIALTQRTTGWLPDNINNGRLDKVYWMLLVVGVINFGYYLICAKFYRHWRSIPLSRTSHTLLPRISNITSKHINCNVFNDYGDCILYEQCCDSSNSEDYRMVTR
jgi:peptide/histidine transporter 3/4